MAYDGTVKNWCATWSINLASRTSPSLHSLGLLFSGMYMYCPVQCPHMQAEPQCTQKFADQIRVDLETVDVFFLADGFKLAI